MLVPETVLSWFSSQTSQEPVCFPHWQGAKLEPRHWATDKPYDVKKKHAPYLEAHKNNVGLHANVTVLVARYVSWLHEFEFARIDHKAVKKMKKLIYMSMFSIINVYFDWEDEWHDSDNYRVCNFSLNIMKKPVCSHLLLFYTEFLNIFGLCLLLICGHIV